MQPRIRLRGAVVDNLLAQMGHTSDAKRAEFIGIAKSQYIRVRNRTVAPGEQFIAKLLWALRDLTVIDFEDIFEVVADDESEQVA